MRSLKVLYLNLLLSLTKLRIITTLPILKLVNLGDVSIKESLISLKSKFSENPLLFKCIVHKSSAFRKQNALIYEVDGKLVGELSALVVRKVS